MQLVPTDIHDKTAHTGGFAIWKKAVAIAGGLAASVSNASASDWVEFGVDMVIPLVLAPSELGVATLYGPGTPYPTYKDYAEAMKARMEQQKQQEEVEP
jgi:hypothetical protein